MGAFDLGHSDDRTRFIGGGHPRLQPREAGLKSVRLGYGRERGAGGVWGWGAV